jgi:hypothetical protein
MRKCENNVRMGRDDDKMWKTKCQSLRRVLMRTMKSMKVGQTTHENKRLTKYNQMGG